MPIFKLKVDIHLEEQRLIIPRCMGATEQLVFELGSVRIRNGFQEETVHDFELRMCHTADDSSDVELLTLDHWSVEIIEMTLHTAESLSRRTPRAVPFGGRLSSTATTVGSQMEGERCIVEAKLWIDVWRPLDERHSSRLKVTMWMILTSLL